MSQNIRLIISYHGYPFKGWQNAHQQNSIEEKLSSTLQLILRHPVKLQAASRTDAGVHALGQVVNFFLDIPFPLDRLVYRLNRLLSPHISVQSAEMMPHTFHPTLDSLAKEYWYHICYDKIQLPFYRDTSWHFPHLLNLDWIQEVSSFFIGTHDFSALCNQRPLWNRDPVCTLYSIDLIPLAKKRIRFSVTGNRFLYKMMRNLVGTLAYVGCGKIEKEKIPEILAKKRRVLSGMTAPAHGLTLKQIFYESTFLSKLDLPPQQEQDI